MSEKRCPAGSASGGERCPSVCREHRGSAGRYVVLHGRGDARVEVSCRGAQVTSWQAAGRERLFMSPQAVLRAGHAIRGGIPVIFPQFGASGPGLRHGFARSLDWSLVCQNTTDQPEISLVLRDSPQSRQWWPHAFEATMSVALGGEQLTTTLSVGNLDRIDIAFTAALHSYFRVTDITQATVEGLHGCAYIDSTRDGARAVQQERLLRFTGETDRVYPDSHQSLILHDADNCLTVRSQGFLDTVVWNPRGQLAAKPPTWGLATMPRLSASKRPASTKRSAWPAARCGRAHR